MMVKEAKFFRKQAEKAERMALAASDADASQTFSSLAQAYRSQAAALKKDKLKKKTQKDKSPKKKKARTLKIKKSTKKSRRA
jgi:hypothetical protein